MEKIIAAVIMIMIVVGLIVMVIMPQSKSMQAIGNQANTQTNQFQDNMFTITGQDIVNNYKTADANQAINVQLEGTTYITVSALKSALSSKTTTRYTQSTSGDQTIYTKYQ